MQENQLKPFGVTIREAKRLIPCSHTTIYELIKQHKLQTFTIGRRRLVLLSSIEELTRAA